MEILFDSRVLFRIFVDCSLILEKYREFFAKLSGIFGGGIIFQMKMAWTRSMADEPPAALVHGGPRIGPWQWLNGGRPERCPSV
jgi:hypothetical protein